MPDDRLAYYRKQFARGNITEADLAFCLARLAAAGSPSDLMAVLGDAERGLLLGWAYACGCGATCMPASAGVPAEEERALRHAAGVLAGFDEDMRRYSAPLAAAVLTARAAMDAEDRGLAADAEALWRGHALAWDRIDFAARREVMRRLAAAGRGS